MKRVMLFGTFDILHAGHLYVFKKAGELGSVTAVVARDGRVKKIKGQSSIHSERERAEILGHIDLIDKVVLGSAGNDVYRIIKKERPDIIVLGYDQNHFVDQLQEKIIEYGLKTKIIRLEPRKEAAHKSGKIRKKILENL